MEKEALSLLAPYSWERGRGSEDGREEWTSVMLTPWPGQARLVSWQARVPSCD